MSKYTSVVINGKVEKIEASHFVILASLVRIGDRVMLAIPEDSHAEGGERNGILGTCVGHHVYRTHQDRYHRNPGLYQGNGNPVIAWDDGTFTTSTSPHHLVHQSPNTAKDRNRQTMEAFDTMVKLGELPELPFWESDIVRMRQVSGNEECSISRIDYDQVGQRDLIYDVRASGYVTRCSANELELVRRGDIWLYHNDRAALATMPIKELMALHGKMELWEQVRNPNTKNYHFPLEDVLPAAKAGLIDVIVERGLFGASIKAGYKFLDPDVSARANKLTIEGFQ